MSVTKVNNEKARSAISDNADFPGYPDLPPPYSSVGPQNDKKNDDQKEPTLKVPTAPQESPRTDRKNDDHKKDNTFEQNDKDDNVVRPIEFMPKPMRMTCPCCKAEIKTRTERHPTIRTHACACLLFWMVWWPCICLPYCLPGCNNVDHFCPNCDSYIGGFRC